MEANRSKILDVLSKEQLFEVPIFQRSYSWERHHCNKLWEDIKRIAENDKISSHFIGSIVYISEGEYRASGINHLLLIDGQQRITTISLLLIALYNYINKNNKETTFNPDKVKNQYLINQYAPESEKIKLILSKKDKNIYDSILKGIDIDENVVSRIKDTYNFFYNQLDSEPIEKIINGLNKILVVWISLERDKDDPQLIFESINSTGLDLTQSDLIRNFLLMDLKIDFQKQIYEKYWLHIENKLGTKIDLNKRMDLITSFIRDYLTIKKGEIPTIDKVYETFKDYFIKITDKKDLQDYEQKIKEIYEYSKLYYEIKTSNVSDKDINTIIENINALEVTVAYPLIMEIYKLYKIENSLKKEDFIEILLLIESYVFRRSICDLPTNSLNKVFLKFTTKINNYSNDLLNYLKYSLIISKDKTKFPTDEEFKFLFKRKNIYKFKKNLYLLLKLENYNNNETKTTSEVTIEHIMPQKLSKEWKDSLGDDYKKIYEEYLHTIGNITLTGYNKSYSNKSFNEKLNSKSGYKESTLKLNSYLKSLTEWNKDSIEKRAEILSEIGIKIWNYPHLEKEVFNFYNGKESEGKVNAFTEKDLLKSASEHINYLYNLLKKEVLNIDYENIQFIPTKKYIAFKIKNKGKNICDIIIWPNQINIQINMKKGTLNEKFLIDVSDKGTWGNGDYKFILKEENEIDIILPIIKKSYIENSKQQY